MKLNDQIYNFLKWLAQYFLPALGTLYFALSGIWGLPYGEQVLGTLTALTAFLGVILGLSKSQYNKEDHSDGVLKIDTTNPESDVYTVQLKDKFDDINLKKEITLAVDVTPSLSVYKGD